MLSKEFMQLMNDLDNKSGKENINREKSAITKPLLYIILKCNTPIKQA